MGASADESETEWVSAAIFKRLRLRSLQSVREATCPVPSAAWVSLLLERHGLLNPQREELQYQRAAAGH